MTNEMTRHEHAGTGTTLERTNCAACVLNGYGDKKNGEPIEPNYSGWVRVYIENGKPIPAKYRAGFTRALRSDNRAYAEAIIDDIIKYGVTIL